MNILFSSDDNYARHMGVAILSILQHNLDVERIHFYVVNNHISPSNIKKLESIIEDFNNAELMFIPFEHFEKRLHLNLAWPISLSSYARLFIGEILPEEVERVLYLDCDIIVNGSLLELYNTDLNAKCLGAIQDTIPSKTKASVGLHSRQPYFNAGVILIDVVRWKQLSVGERCLNYIESHQGRVVHHDQGVMNAVLKDLWLRLPLRYNVMTIHYMMSQSKIKKYYKDEAMFYSAEETYSAIKNPIILHFTPSFTTRPWETNCSHPMKYLYNHLLNMTQWKDFPPINDRLPWYVRLINYRFRFFPF